MATLEVPDLSQIRLRTIFSLSVPIRPEWNVLVNPLHPRAGEICVVDTQPVGFDARMFLAG